MMCHKFFELLNSPKFLWKAKSFSSDFGESR